MLSIKNKYKRMNGNKEKKINKMRNGSLQQILIFRISDGINLRKDS
ncbi:protein of unknown function [Xenorhabdus nematophila AN6/1]|nr:protein of unknown function [Xenorhabdus nematophila AN6/1]